MSGHNKWSKIKHKKANTDSLKSKVYSKYNKLIQVAIKNVNGDVNSASVISVIENAKKENVPKDNIDRAIKKATGTDSVDLQEVMYEGFGLGGVGILIKAITDNTNRTVTEIKNLFVKNGGSFATSGAVSWGFTKNNDMDWIANSGTELKISEEEMRKLENLIEIFKENEDVTDVYTNAI